MKRSYGDKGGEDNQVIQPKDMFSREMTGIFFARYMGEQPKKAYAIIALKCRTEKLANGKVKYFVREAASRQINEERKKYPKNVGVYYWASGLNREPVVVANVEDIIEDEKLHLVKGSKRWDWDFYDTHCYVEVLKKIRSVDGVVQWTENGLTDLLAAPDGGLIKWVKDRTNQLVEETRMEMPGEWLDEKDPVSMSTRGIVLLNAYGKA